MTRLLLVCLLSSTTLAIAQQSVQINELVAKNETGIIDEMNEREDWIELRNPTAAPISVSGMYLTDNLANPTQWRIPSGYTLQPGQALLIWADNEPFEGPLHATFKIDQEGDDIALFAANGTTRLDYLAFDKVRGDHSLGRMFDGGDLWVSFARPTPGVANAPGAPGQRNYSSRLTGANDMDIDVAGTARIATAMRVDADNAPGNSPAALYVAAEPDHLALPLNGTVLLLKAPILLLTSGTTDAAGKATFSVPIPDNVALVNQAVFLQGFSVMGATLVASNGIEVRFASRNG